MHDEARWYSPCPLRARQGGESRGVTVTPEQRLTWSDLLRSMSASHAPKSSKLVDSDHVRTAF